METYAVTKNSKLFFSAIKEVYGPTKPRTTPLLSADGSTLLKEKSSINVRWREHFSTLLSRPSTVDPTVLDQIPQKPVITSLDLPPTIDEVSKAIKQTSLGKSPGMDWIPAEIFKSAGPVALEALHSVLIFKSAGPVPLEALHSLLTSIWEEEDVPKEFRNATFVSLFKNRGSKTDYSNYRAISLLSVAGKILARVILKRLITNMSEENLREAQCGFRPNRSTTDMIFTVRQVQEKCMKQNMDLVAVFIDLTKAFDAVNREALWVILSKLRCTIKFVNLIRQFYNDRAGQVLSDGEASEPFSISNAVMQGCVLAPVLFNLFFTCALNHAIRDLEQRVYLRCRLDGSLFDIRRPTTKTKTVQKTVLETLFADDCAFMAHRESDLQIIFNKFAEASRLPGLTISLGKTEVLLQPAPAAVAHRPTISIDGTQLKTVNDFNNTSAA